MIHKIANQELELKLTGTVGIIYATEREIGHEPDSTKQKDLVGILYTALKKSKDRKGQPLNENMPTLEEFEDSMTMKLIGALSKDFWAQWRDIEGLATDNEQQAAEEAKKGED